MNDFIKTIDDHGLAAFVLGLFILGIVGLVVTLIIRLVHGYPPKEVDKYDDDDDD
jgi:hypothetical protein